MNEEKNINMENGAETTETKRIGFFGKVKSKFHKADKNAEPDGSAEDKPKKPLIEKIKENKGKIIGGAIVTGMAIGAGLKLLANAKTEGEIDPDFDCEPGDENPEDDLEDMETSSEVETEE